MDINKLKDEFIKINFPMDSVDFCKEKDEIIVQGKNLEIRFDENSDTFNGNARLKIFNFIYNFPFNLNTVQNDRKINYLASSCELHVLTKEETDILEYFGLNKVYFNFDKNNLLEINFSSKGKIDLKDRISIDTIEDTIKCFYKVKNYIM